MSQRKGYQKKANHQPVEEEEATEDASCSTMLQSVAIQTEVSCFDEASVAIQTDISCFDEASVAIQTDLSCFDEASVAIQTDIHVLMKSLWLSKPMIFHALELPCHQVWNCCICIYIMTVTRFVMFGIFISSAASTIITGTFICSRVIVSGYAQITRTFVTPRFVFVGDTINTSTKAIFCKPNKFIWLFAPTTL